MDVTAVVVAVVSSIELLLLGLKDEVAEEVVRGADCEDEDGVIAVRPATVGMEFGELVVVVVAVVAVTGLSSVDAPLLLPVVLLLAEHCPAYAQYCTLAQHIDPHDASPNPLLQLNDLLSVVLVLAEHCPAYAQYCTPAQHIDPHDASPNPLLQLNDIAVAAAVVEVCVEVELAGADTGTKEGDWASDSEVERISALPLMENLLGDASQQSVPPLSSGRFVSQQ